MCGGNSVQNLQPTDATALSFQPSPELAAFTVMLTVGLGADLRDQLADAVRVSPTPELASSSPSPLSLRHLS